MAKGIEERHARSCRSATGGRCNCERTYRAHVWDNKRRKLIRRTFPSHKAARLWREDAIVALRRGHLRTPAKTTLETYATDWLERARSGAVHSRSGKPYRPSSLRGYERALRRVLAALGPLPLADIRRRDVQALVDRLIGEGVSPATVTRTLDPLRAIYRHAERRDLVEVNPTHGLELPQGHGRRERVAAREEAATLIAAVPAQDRALWATAFYAGLRRGELRALRWSQVLVEDVEGRRRLSRIRVVTVWDDVEGELQGGKSKNADREVGIAEALRAILAEHKLATGRDGDDLVFGRTATEPFTPSTIRRRALDAWAAAGLEPIGLHEARHTWVSLCIDAEVNPHTLMVEAGHGSYSMTMEHYGKTMPGAIEHATAQLDAYLDCGKAVGK